MIPANFSFTVKMLFVPGGRTVEDVDSVLCLRDAMPLAGVQDHYRLHTDRPSDAAKRIA